MGVYSYFNILSKVSIAALKNIIDWQGKFGPIPYKEFMAGNFFKLVCKSFGNQITDGKEEKHFLNWVPKELIAMIVYGLPFPSWKHGQSQSMNNDNSSVVDITDSDNPVILQEINNNYLDELADAVKLSLMGLDR